MCSRTLVCALLILAACSKDNGDSNTGDDSGSSKVDADNDGYNSTEDCDDTNADVHPDAKEVCDEIDNNCVGGVDEGVTTAFYMDGDADGYGAGKATDACAAPTGYVANADDCDDTDPAVHPGAAEVCDGIDNDCNGSVDAGAIDATWYADNDADGFGDESLGWCANTPGGVDVGGDCDDDDLAVNPSANEICDDGVDNDCDGRACAHLDLSHAHATLIAEEGGDFVGSVSGAGDMDGDGHGDLLVGAWDLESGTDAGAAYLVLGPVTGTLDVSLADAKLVGEQGDEAGWSVSGGGDVDGDGDDDLLVGAMNHGGDYAGAAYLVLGPVTGTLDLSLADAKLVGEEAWDQAWKVSDAGNVDGDGHDDVLVGSYFNGEGGPYAGAVYLVLGPVTGTLDLSLADAKLVGENESDYAGVVSGAGDVDGDGHDDVLVGAMWNDQVGAADAGAAYLVLGPVTGTLDLSLADAKLVGEEAGDSAGGVSGAGDMDGDGHDDVLVGAIMSTDAGAAYLVLGPVTGTLDLSLADAKLVGEEAGDYAGGSVSGAGDVNSDGNADVLVGADGNDDGGMEAGAAYLVLGPVTGTLDVSSADWEFVGGGPYDYAGRSLSCAGDVDNDGYDDVLMRSLHSDGKGDYPGAAYLVYGGGLF